MMPLDAEINAKVVDLDRDCGITGEGVQQSFTTEASGTLGITVPGTAPDGSHFKFDILADGVQFFPAATSMMSQTLFPITFPHYMVYASRLRRNIHWSIFIRG